MKSIDRPLRIFAIKQQKVLDRLFPLTQDIDDILREVSSQKCCDWCKFAAQILQEASQKLAAKRFWWQLQLLVLFCSERRKEFEICVRVRG